MKEGIVVASDITQEWLLPWWWHAYQKHNPFPVAFVDFGLSFPMKEWCKKKGPLIALPIFADFVKEKEEIDPALAQLWEKTFGHFFWESRGAWFKKPLACLRTPFERTLWIDLDCEVHASLAPLFPYARSPSRIGIALDQTESGKSASFPIYNSGVIAFHRRSKLIADWASQCTHMNHLLTGDQDILSHLIAQRSDLIVEIPPIYNWSRRQEENPHAVITHWHGPHGKAIIRTHEFFKETPLTTSDRIGD